MNDYHRIKSVIEFLEQHQDQQPGLERIAEFAELSPAHLQRLFSQWAGISPKAFLKCLTLEYAKEMLKRGKSVLDASLDSGLSGPGRLHDLCVSLESATPGEIKSGGQGWNIDAGYCETPFGCCLIGKGPRGICHLSFHSQPNDLAGEELQALWPQAQIHWNDDVASKTGNALFVRQESNSKSPQPLKAIVKGTQFQVQVWRALLELPPGFLASYGQIAKLIGQPKSSRAVGTAVGQNPIGFLIPCHRVIRETGVIGQYRWDSVRKKAMIAWESVSAMNR